MQRKLYGRPEITLTASADTCSTFGGWSEVCTNASGDCAVAMTETQSVTATFALEQIDYLIFAPIIMRPWHKQ